MIFFNLLWQCIKLICNNIKNIASLIAFLRKYKFWKILLSLIIAIGIFTVALHLHYIAKSINNDKSHLERLKKYHNEIKNILISANNGEPNALFFIQAIDVFSYKGIDIGKPRFLFGIENGNLVFHQDTQMIRQNETLEYKNIKYYMDQIVQGKMGVDGCAFLSNKDLKNILKDEYYASFRKESTEWDMHTHKMQRTCGNFFVKGNHMIACPIVQSENISYLLLLNLSENIQNRQVTCDEETKLQYLKARLDDKSLKQMIKLKQIIEDDIKEKKYKLYDIFNFK